MKGMMAHPSDRFEASARIAKAGGGTLEHSFVTTGPTDFMMTVRALSAEFTASMAPSRRLGRISNMQIRAHGAEREGGPDAAYAPPA
jgi:hypothetical protein